MFDIVVIFVIFLSLVVAFLRGFIKEVFGLLGIFLSIAFTVNFYDYFVENYNSYVSSEGISVALSSITVFIIVTVTIIIANSWIMYLLSSIRLGIIDRFAGLLIGAVKGIVISYFLFFIIKLSCYTFLSVDNNTDERSEENVFPIWFASSYSYTILNLLDNYVNEVLPKSTHDKVQDIGSNIQEMLDKKSIKERKKVE